MEIFKKENEKVVIDENNNVVVSIKKGSLGGLWTSTGFFNSKKYTIVKNNGKFLDEDIKFGTINAVKYNPIICDFFIKDGDLYVEVLRKTSKWSHRYFWKVVKS